VWETFRPRTILLNLSELFADLDASLLLCCVKIHGQDHAVYFSAVPLVDWPVGVCSAEPCPTSSRFSEVGDGSLDEDEDGDNDGRTSYGREKL
jgi:hypothetical protein